MSLSAAPLRSEQHGEADVLQATPDGTRPAAPAAAGRTAAGFYWIAVGRRTCSNCTPRSSSAASTGETDAARLPEPRPPRRLPRPDGRDRDPRPASAPQATWLVVRRRTAASARCRGCSTPHGFGGIQNLGVVPDTAGSGIGRALLLKALDGFASVGARRAFLEVTATNEPAVRMYRAVGFRATRRSTAAVELPPRRTTGRALGCDVRLFVECRCRARAAVAEGESVGQQVYQHTLPNGLVLLAERMDHVRSAALNFLVPAGLRLRPARPARHRVACSPR